MEDLSSTDSSMDKAGLEPGRSGRGRTEGGVGRRLTGRVCGALLLALVSALLGFVGGMVLNDLQHNIAPPRPAAPPSSQPVVNPNFTAVCSVCAEAR